MEHDFHDEDQISLYQAQFGNDFIDWETAVLERADGAPVGDWRPPLGFHSGQARSEASLCGPQRAIIRDEPPCGFATLPSATPRLWDLVGSRAWFV